MHISINITCFASHSTHCRFTDRRWCYHPFQCQVSTNSSIPSSPRWQTLSSSRWDKWRLGSQISKLIKLDGTTDGNQEITAVPFQLSDMLKLAVGTGDLGICPCQIQTPLPSASNFLNNRGMSPQSGRRKNCMLLGLYSPFRSMPWLVGIGRVNMDGKMLEYLENPRNDTTVPRTPSMPISALHLNQGTCWNTPILQSLSCSCHQQNSMAIRPSLGHGISNDLGRRPGNDDILFVSSS